MDDLTAVKPIYVNGKWLPQGAAVPGDLMGFDYEKAARKGMIASASGADIINLVPEQEDAEAQQAEGVDALQARVAALSTELEEVKAERDAARKAVQEGQLIPADALERIIEVKGVGEKLAPVILDALTAPAQE